MKRIKKIFETRISWKCPACGKQGWIACFSNDRKGYGHCAWCKNTISWRLIIKENEYETNNK